MRRLFLILLQFFFLIPISFSQEVDTLWVRRYNGPANLNDYPWAITVDSSGKVYVTGQSFSYNSGYDYTTIKYLPDGDTAWLRKYNGTGNKDDGAVALALDPLENLVVTGWSIGTGTIYNYDYLTLKYYPDGETAWVRRYPGPVEGLDDAATALAIDSSGNIFVTGHSWDTVTFDDYATFKYYFKGDTAWLRRYNGPGYGYDHPKALCVDNYGNLYITGLSQGDQTGFDYATLKYYSNGDTAWLRRYNSSGSSDDDAIAIGVDNSENVYVTGSSYNSFTDYDYATVKYRSNGDTAWVRRYNGPGNFEDRATTLAIDKSNHLYVTGYSFSEETDFDYATLKYNSSGNLLWERRYNGPGDSTDLATSITLDDSGYIYITGESFGNGKNLDFATLKYDPSGNLLWIKRYTGTGEDRPKALAVDDSFKVYVTGQSYETGTKFDYLTIKYNQIIFYRGDANQDNQITISDIVYLISYLFKSGPSPNPLSVGDCNCDGKITISDAVFLINYLFKSGPKPEC